MSLGQRQLAVSGKWTVVNLLLSLLSAAFIVPFVVRSEVGIRAFALLVAWWMIWTITLARLLYRRVHVIDDHAMSAPRDWGLTEAAESAARDVSDTIVTADAFTGRAGWQGCAIAIALAASLMAIWFLVELAIPAFAFVIYFIVRMMIARVANDAHGCEGNIGRSLGWGGLWAAAYTLPLAILVFLLWRMHFHGG